MWWEEVVPAQAPACPAVDTDASEPYMIIYTSGTTGRPKGALHAHAGFPLKAAQTSTSASTCSRETACCGTRTWGG